MMQNGLLHRRNADGGCDRGMNAPHRPSHLYLISLRG